MIPMTSLKQLPIYTVKAVAYMLKFRDYVMRDPVTLGLRPLKSC